MTTLVAFLRGINVGGINIKMADLAQTFTDLGFTRVQTILASGNVRFVTAEPNDERLKRRIEDALTERFGYDAWVIVHDVATVQHIIDAYPFDEGDADRQPNVMFLADPALGDELFGVAGDLDPAVERIQPGERVIYWEVEKGESTQSAFAKHTARARFKPLVTTRNLRTLRKVCG